MVVVWFGVVLLVRFPSDVAPIWNPAARGTNNPPDVRKTDGETSRRARHGKDGLWEFSGAMG